MITTSELRRRYRAQQAARPKPIRFLALDPGTRNFAWVLITLTDGQIAIERGGMLPADLFEGAPKNTVLKQWGEFFGQLLFETKPTHIGWERFEVRGRTNASLGEVMNLVLGVMTCVANITDGPDGNGLIVMDSTSAMAWKNYTTRLLNQYLGTTGDSPWRDCITIPGAKTKTVHAKDAIGIGLCFMTQAGAGFIDIGEVYRAGVQAQTVDVSR